MTKNKKAKSIKKRLYNFSARGSNCPICGKDFRNKSGDKQGCPHSVAQAISHLEIAYLKEVLRNREKVK